MDGDYRKLKTAELLKWEMEKEEKRKEATERLEKERKEEREPSVESLAASHQTWSNRGPDPNLLAEPVNVSGHARLNNAVIAAGMTGFAPQIRQSHSPIGSLADISDSELNTADKTKDDETLESPGEAQME